KKNDGIDHRPPSVRERVAVKRRKELRSIDALRFSLPFTAFPEQRAELAVRKQDRSDCRDVVVVRHEVDLGRLVDRINQVERELDCPLTALFVLKCRRYVCCFHAAKLLLALLVLAKRAS